MRKLRIGWIGPLALLLAACGPDERKAEFDAYDRKVSPILAEEEKLLARLDDAGDDVLTYRNTDEFVSFIRNQLQPFYGRMQKSIAEVAPAAPELAGIHESLDHYVKLRIEQVEEHAKLIGLIEAPKEGVEAALRPLVKARDEASRLLSELQAAAEAAPAVYQALATPLGREGFVATQLFNLVAGFEAGGAPPAAELRRAVEQNFRPHYDELEKAIAETELPEGGEKIRRILTEYVGRMRTILDHAVPVAEAIGENLVLPTQVQQRVQALMKEADAARTAYFEEAKRYRESLR